MRLAFAFVPALAFAACAACTTPRMPDTGVPHNEGSAALQAKTVALVAEVQSGDRRAYCSGVWVSQSYILTANHCVDEVLVGDPVEYVVREDVLAEAADWVATVRLGVLSARDEEHDLALVLAKLPPMGHGVAGVATPSVGQPVQTMGHPMGLWWSYSTGEVAAIRVLDEGTAQWYVQSTAPISPGNSGGGLFDEAGNVLGIAHAYIATRAENVNFYVHAQYVAAFLAKEGVQ